MPSRIIANRRLFNQGIIGMKHESPEQVVRGLGAVQAQDYHQAVWGIGLRTQSAKLSEVEQAMIDRKIVLTWPMRGTIFFVPAEDAKWMVKLTESRFLTNDKKKQAELELDGSTLHRCRTIIGDALSGCTPVSRPRLMELLEEAGISTKNGRGYYILGYLGRTGMICFGPHEGKQQSFVLLDEWVPNSRELTLEESLGELALRYFIGHGPATIQDFAWWVGLTLTEAKRGFEAVKSNLRLDFVNGTEYWSSVTAPAVSADTDSVVLLPGFDEYYLGYKDRSAIIETEHDAKIAPHRNGVFQPMMVAGGEVVGVWKREIKRSGIEITFSPFTLRNDREEEFMEAAKQYSDFVGMPMTRIEWNQAL
ncbi:winged helix DNA-binding domain-containing protein [Virgibacillus sp. LDC1]|uniref:winged helix DNA-binding domain-containing protein n=1 Tax=Paenibacillus lautus TaxID=1401 RepID=UPI002DBA0C4B|nr:winged helix DNA-binding domain-containing protein [Paenibacillus lautus]MCV4232360.1 winged helix DNA-binding domain-containing protein [Virgibacillus sp. LDC1]MEC0257350.1 winged helix DNA-binding domain-containing protein [Paenibacillus lautus]